MTDIVIACIIGWFVALLTALTIGGIVTTVKGALKIVSNIYILLIDSNRKEVLWK